MCPAPFNVDDLEQHGPALRRLARGLVRGADVDDLVQDTLVAAWQSPRGPRVGMRGWLRGIARNLAAKTYRESARRFRREAAVARRGEVPSTGEVLARLELQRRVLLEVERLDEPYRRAIYLRYFEDEPPREIARRLAVSVATVHTWLRRGRGRLRERLDERCQGQRTTWVALLRPPPGAPKVVNLLLGALLVKRSVITVLVLVFLALAAWQGGLLPDLDLRGGNAALQRKVATTADRPRLVGREAEPKPVEAEIAEGVAAPQPAPTHRLQLRLYADGGLPEGTAHVRVRPIRKMEVGDRWDGSDVWVDATTSVGLLDQDLSLLFEPHAFPLIEIQVNVDHPSCMPAQLRFKRSEGTRPAEDGPLVYVGEIVLRRAGVLRGRVRTESGAAVSRAAVGVWPEVSGEPGSPVERAFTDEMGRYRLRVPDAGEWWVVAGTRDRTPARTVASAGPGGVVEVEDLVLRPGLAIGGAFLINGVPVPEASLQLSRPPDRDAWQHRYDLRLDALRAWIWHERGGLAEASDLRLWMRAGELEIRAMGTLTKEDGTFRLGGLRAGAYTLQLPAHVSTGFLHPHVIQAERTIKVPSAPLRIDLETATLRVRVVSEGRSVEDASVAIGLPGPVGPGGARWGPSARVSCRFDGLTMPVLVRPAFTYHFTVRAKGYAALEREVTSPRAGLENVVTLEVGPSGEEDASVLPPHGSVRARIRTPDGARIAKAAFGFYRGVRSHAVHRRIVDLEGGVFLIEDIPVGRWRLVSRAGGTWIGGEAFWQDAEEEIEIVDGETVDVTFDVHRGGRLRLQARDAHGRPVGARCRLLGPKGRPFPALYVLRGSGHAGWGPNLGANEGPYEVDRVLPPGRYVVKLETSRDRPPRTATGEVLVEAGKVATLEIRVPDA